MENHGVRVAILGSGNIGTDLMHKIARSPGSMELALVAGIDEKSEGLARARSLGISTSHDGVRAVLDDPSIRIVFDATGAREHLKHAASLKKAGKITIDLTPAAVGPFVVPPVNLHRHLDEPNVNLITCGGQATIPLVHAVSRVSPVTYAEIVSTIASASAGPGTRQNIDEFTFTTSRGIQELGGAAKGKALIILNPADPPILMRNTVYVLPESTPVNQQEITSSVERMVAEVQAYVPGYRLRAPVVYDKRQTPWGERTVVVILLEVEGAGDWLPPYAGNLDIMTASAHRVGELMAQRVVVAGAGGAGTGARRVGAA
jgi:acetaldehyde dehydrogenase